MSRGWSLAAVIVSCLATLPAIADDAERIRKLEEEVGALKVVVGDLIQELSKKRDMVPSEPVRNTGPGLRLPEVTLAGFSDLRYEVTDVDPDAGSRSFDNNFAVGDLDLFLVSRLSERFSFFSEILVHFTDDHESSLEVARLMLKFDYADWLTITGGRTHTPVGYWNNTFGHPSWLRTTIERPLLYRFEDEGGVLPIHTVGIELSGYADTEVGTFGYIANVGNGRGLASSPIQVTSDLNDPKMLSLMATYEPSWAEGLSFGANGYRDLIPKDPGEPGRDSSINEFIGGAYLAFLRDPYELLIEGQVIRHDLKGSKGTWYSGGGYAQFAYRVGNFLPYYRFDLLEIDGGDPFYAQIPEAEDATQHTLGVRFDWSNFVALKLEIRRRLSQSFDSVEGTGEVSFAF